MRFAAAHKLSTYLTVGAAYGAIALGGELGALQLLLALIGIVASWWWEPPRVRLERWSRAWTGISIGVFGLTALAWLGGTDILIAGAHFLLYLMVAKLFNRGTNRDYIQVLVLSFLMLVAGTVLNAGFSYGLFFLGFVVFSTWALILLHLRREMEDNFLLKHARGEPSQRVQVQRILDSRRIVGGKFFAATSLISIAVFLAATFLFLAIPRVGLGLFFPKRRGGVTLAGFEDDVQLGQHGTIKNDATVVMRAYVEPPFRGRAAPPIHWRGVAFDEYQDGRWQRSERAPLTEQRSAWRHGGVTLYLKYDRFGMGPEEMRDRVDQGVHQRIYLEPMGNDVLFGAAMPMAFSIGESLAADRRREKVAYNDEVRFDHGAGLVYDVWSDPEPPPANLLRQAPERLPDLTAVQSHRDRREKSYDVYLQVPPEITERTRQLAAQLTRDAPTWYDKAVAIESYLRGELGYTLEMVAPPDGQEPIDFFLFDRRRGHCEYFASAMTIMLRSVGVPARNVNGFLGGAWNEYGEYIAVRSGDAHSWVEVYFPTIGWVTFDPTPPGQRDQLGPGGEGIRERLERFMDTLRLKWFQWVIEYDLQRQLSLFRSLRNSLSGGGSLKGAGRDARELVLRHRVPLGVFGGGVLSLAVALIYLRRRKTRLSSLDLRGPITRHQSAVASIYLSAEKKMARRGHRRPASATPREYARTLGRRGVPGHLDFLALTDVYYRAVYGRGDADRGDQSALVTRARELRERMNTAWKQRKNH